MIMLPFLLVASNFFQLGLADGVYHLAPGGASTCDYGMNVGESECESTSAMLVSGPIGRVLQIGSVGSCGDGAWGNVPPGCSAQTGGDNAAHFMQTDLMCSGYNSDYQLVCKSTPAPTADPTTTMTPTQDPTTTMTPTQ